MEPPPAPAESKKRVNPMKLKKLRDRLNEVEEQVSALESEISQYEATFADFKSVDETLRMTDLLAARRSDLQARVSGVGAVVRVPRRWRVRITRSKSE